MKTQLLLRSLGCKFRPATLGWLFALALTEAALSTARAEEWRLTYAVTEKKESTNAKVVIPAPDQTRSYTLTATLGADYLVIDDEKQCTVYDFSACRRLIVQKEKKDLVNFSLFSVVGFRVEELQHRMALDGGARAANVIMTKSAGATPVDKSQGMPVSGRFTNETNLNLQFPQGPGAEPKPVIERVDMEGGSWEFRHEGRSAVSFQPANTPVPSDHFRRYASFLTYCCTMHPEIRRQIAKAGKVAQVMAVSSHLGQISTVATYRLLSTEAQSTDSRTGVRAGLNDLAAKGWWVDVLAKAEKSRTRAPRTSRDEAAKSANDAIAKRDPMGALLILTQFYAETGVVLLDELRRHQPHFAKNTQCQLYLSGANTSTREACEKDLTRGS